MRKRVGQPENSKKINSLGIDTITLCYALSCGSTRLILNDHKSWRKIPYNNTDIRIRICENFRFTASYNSYYRALYATTELSRYDKNEHYVYGKGLNVGSFNPKSVDTYLSDLNLKLKNIRMPVKAENGLITRLDVFFDCCISPTIEQIIKYTHTGQKRTLRVFDAAAKITWVYILLDNRWVCEEMPGLAMPLYLLDKNIFSLYLKMGLISIYIGNKSWELNIYRKFSECYGDNIIIRHEVRFLKTSVCRVSLGQARYSCKLANNVTLLKQYEHVRFLLRYVLKRISSLYSNNESFRRKVFNEISRTLLLLIHSQRRHFKWNIFHKNEKCMAINDAYPSNNNHMQLSTKQQLISLGRGPPLVRSNST